MMDLASRVWWANEVRIWGLAIAATVAVIGWAATWSHSRWQAQLAAEKEEAASTVIGYITSTTTLDG